MPGKKKDEKESLATYRRIVWYDEKIASGTYPNVKTFMDKWEISEATVHRDLDALRDDFGAAEYLEYDRFKKGYHYKSPTFRIPGLLTTERQIISAQLMSNLLNIIKGTPVYTQAIEVFTTLASNIEQDSKLNAKKLSNRILFLGMEPVDIKDQTWGLLEEALSTNRYISFDYEKDGHINDVTMKPYQLIYYNGMWSLYGYNTNPKYEGLRFFNLPVIKNVRIKKETFELPADFSYEKHAVGNFGRFIGNETFEFKLEILSSYTEDYAKMYKWAADQKFESQSDGTTIMTFTSNQYLPVLNWVLARGMYIKPLAPEKLVNDWKKNVIAMAKMAEEM
nr:WYL domain-containing protein [uncultured Treponema sp.]